MKSLDIRRKLTNGFSLIEMSIIVTAFAVLMTAMLGGKSIEQDGKIFLSTQQKIQKIHNALNHYYNFYGFFPCPASYTIASSHADYGKATACATNGIAGVEDIDNGTGSDQYALRLGMVPTRALGLPDEYSLDEWGNRISYVAVRSLAISRIASGNYNPTQTTDYFQILNNQGNILVGNSPTDIPAYFVFSHGKDAKGAYTKEGSLAFPCGNVSDGKADSANCDRNKQFSQFPISELRTDTSYYYDVATWQKFALTANGGAGIVLNQVSNIVAFDTATCILTATKRIFCSGQDTEGRLGNGATGNVTSWTQEALGFSDWEVIVGSNNNRMCALRDGGKLYCWGMYLPEHSWNRYQVPTQVTSFEDWQYIVAENALNEHGFCGIRSNGKIYCWGEDGLNGLTAPAEFDSNTDWIMLAGRCGIRKTGSNNNLYCWGYNNDEGAIGDGTFDDRTSPVPVAVPGVTDWVSVSGSGTNCGLRANGDLYCWGWNSAGQVGTGSYSFNNPTPAIVGAGMNWKSVFVTGNSCGIRQNGELHCWGENNRWQSKGSASPDPDFDRIPGMVSCGISNWLVTASGGTNHACGVSTTGDLYCWGRNSNGQFGNGTTSAFSVAPTLITLPGGVKVKTD